MQGQHTVSLFDFHVDNYINIIVKMSKLCGEPENDTYEADVIKRFSTNVTFLREWRYLDYKPITVRFAKNDVISPAENIVSEINLPQFSSATVPKDKHSVNMTPGSCKDFVLYVGGPVWALDWCPRGSGRSDSLIKCEFVAVATHPPQSSYHKIGAPLTGRGTIQIWCILGVANEEEVIKETQQKRPRGRPRGRPKKNQFKGVDVITKSEATWTQKPKGRRGKNQQKEKKLLFSNQHVLPVTSVFSEYSHHLEDINQDILDPGRDVFYNCSDRNKEISICNKSVENTPHPSLRNKILEVKTHQGHANHTFVPQIMLIDKQDASKKCLRANASRAEEEVVLSSENIYLACDIGRLTIPNDILLPRLVLCLAHNGKVTWDVKWRPYNEHYSKQNPRMGYLAVLLGNGSLEVWEVPSLNMARLLCSSHSDDTDPRFIKLEPVFRCSKLMRGDRQSMPLALEWSTVAPHEFILCGCHDGTVALWRFTEQNSPTDTRPLLCFDADTAPIRTIAWAPDENSDMGSANIIVTAGHEGLKFWDIRDPFRPLWCVSLARKAVNSLDWLPNPRCILLSLDDGTLRILSLVKAAYDVPATGVPFVGTQQQGLSSYCCSSFSIWSVQASQQSGIVAYCGADGTVLRFQLTSRAVEKDHLRNRAPHYLCGSLTEDGPALTVNSCLSDTPFPMKRSVNEWGDTPRTLKGFIYDSNQVKRARNQRSALPNSDHHLLALRYGDNVETEFECEETRKSKSIKRKSSKNDLALVCEDEGLEDGDCSVRSEVEAFPPKMVAIHRVRWNMNKGSERWLCYGGAAGILRCQEIPMPVKHKKSATKTNS